MSDVVRINEKPRLIARAFQLLNLNLLYSLFFSFEEAFGFLALIVNASPVPS